jgi:pSer/pThr/pTyr-binding forkhead associated (FHA) protein
VAEKTYQLLVQKGPAPGKVYTLNKETMVMGRDPASDIVIEDLEVSRQHARMLRTPAGYQLQDMGSTNGSFVDGQRLGGTPVALVAGQLLLLGSNVELVYQVISDIDPMATIIAPSSRTPKVTPAPGIAPDFELQVEPEPEPEPLPEPEPEPEPLPEPEPEPLFEPEPEPEPVADDLPDFDEFEMSFEPEDDPFAAPLPEAPLPTAPLEEEPEPVPPAIDDAFATVLDVPPAAAPAPEPEPELEPEPAHAFADLPDFGDFEPAAATPEPEELPSFESAKPAAEPAKPAAAPRELPSFEAAAPAGGSPPPPPIAEKSGGGGFFSNRRNVIIVVVVVLILLCCCLLVAVPALLGPQIGEVFSSIEEGLTTPMP